MSKRQRTASPVVDFFRNLFNRPKTPSITGTSSAGEPSSYLSGNTCGSSYASDPELIQPSIPGNYLSVDNAVIRRPALASGATLASNHSNHHVRLSHSQSSSDPQYIQTGLTGPDIPDYSELQFSEIPTETRDPWERVYELAKNVLTSDEWPELSTEDSDSPLYWKVYLNHEEKLEKLEDALTTIITTMARTSNQSIHSIFDITSAVFGSNRFEGAGSKGSCKYGKHATNKSSVDRTWEVGIPLE
ncbi:hypothetical protein K440DRAFT_646201 [Wilcoxina mikolae CBS 423.85]|nr:hypothetical protein K440DRAFT_646201 [Wilcoxina mikolae CBS 423.85]